VPAARTYHAMTYDAGRGVTVLFGGGAGQGITVDLRQDTWEWDGVAWTQREPKGPLPPGRHSHAMAYDTARGVTVLFGGYASSERLQDTWEWDGETWTELTPDGPVPAARDNTAIAYDAARSVAVLFGGSNSDGDLQDTWEYAHSFTDRPAHHWTVSWSAAMADAACEVTGLSVQWQGSGVGHETQASCEAIHGTKLMLWTGLGWEPLDESIAVDEGCLPICEPDCEDRACGPDGCGGFCGSCALNEPCEQGLCVASTSVCGDLPYEGCCDGLDVFWCENEQVSHEACEGACGWNVEASYYSCSSGQADLPSDPSGEFPHQCGGACTPGCEGKTCGHDGCGGSCGGCADGTLCDAGQCIQGTCELSHTLSPTLDDPDVLQRLLSGLLGEQTLNFALTPTAPNGCGTEYGRVSTDYVEVTVGYRLPAELPTE
jgi:hypothetical protein